jgi:predicted aspartyl protease
MTGPSRFARVFATIAFLALTVEPTLARERETDAGDPQPVQLKLAPPGVVPGTTMKLTGSAVVNVTDLARLEALGLAPRIPVRVRMQDENENEMGTMLPPDTGPLTPDAMFTPAPFVPFIASPSPGNSFQGLDDIPMVDSSYIIIPPDVGGAVGPNKVMEGFNNNYRIRDKSTGVTQLTVGTATFWNPVVTNKALLNQLTDPRTVYDPIQGRWIVCMQTTNNPGLILFGVSFTSDPAGSWHLYSVSPGFTSAPRLDFPVLGFNKNWIAITINAYTSGGSFSRGGCMIANYPQAAAGTLGSVTDVTQALGTHFCTAPATTISATEDTLYLAEYTLSGTTFQIDRITGTASPTYASVGTLTRTGGAWADPSGNLQPQSAAVSGASACGATPCPIESQDSEIRSAPVYRVDTTTGRGFLYFAQTVGLPSSGMTHTAAQWTKATVGATTAFADGGRIEDATATSSNGGKWYDHTHIAVNSVGDFIVGYTQFSSAQHPSSGYSVHIAADGLATIRDPLIYKAGEDYYHKTFTTATGRNRWGDFSTAQVDPNDDRSLWVLQEYAKTRTGTDDGNTGSNSSKWSTYWAAVAGPAPTVTIAAGPSLNEGNAGTTNFNFTVNLSGLYSLPVTVNYQTANGTATVADGDYQAATSSIIIPSGSTSGTITILVNGDTKCESNETFTVSLTGATNGTVGSPSTSTGTILNDDTPVITASAGAGGTISPNGAVTVTCGANQTFTITPNSCFTIADVKVDGVSQGAISSFTFTNVTTSHTIAATFSALGPFTITASAGAGGTISPSGNVSVNCGANQTFTISPSDKCHAILDVKVDGVSQGAISSFTFTNVQANHSIAATFSTFGPFTITATAGAGGSISPSGAVSVACGGSKTFTISPADKCHAIADVKVDGVSVGAVGSYTFSDVQANHTIAATFSTLGPFTITATAGANGSITPSGAVSVACGASQTFTISPSDKCHAIADVKVDGVSVGAVASYTFSDVQANHTIDATFSTLGPFTITANAGAGGSIAPAGATTVACGGSQSYSISPSDKCHFIADVKVDGVSVGAVATYTFSDVQANHTIDASFGTFGPFTITASAGPGGSISPSGAVSVVCGASQTFSISPSDKCHAILDVKVDGVSVGAVASYTFSDVQANHSIDASFSALGPFTITASASAGGSIAPAGATTVACGGSQSYSISPADKCHFIADVKVDGVSVGAVATYTFSDVQANHSIDASFGTFGPFTITATAGAGGSIGPSGAVSVACGGSQTFSISPADKCHFIADVKVDGVSVGAVGSYTFSDVQANHSIDASFGTFGPFTITASAGAGGSIGPSGAVSVSCGANQVFTITPNPCFHILDVKVDGVSVGTPSSYTFSDVQANHTIAASFAPNALSTAAVTDLAAAQQQFGNDGDGTTRIKLTYSTPAGAASVEVWGKGYGSYPTYDDGGGAVPSVPGSYPPSGWTLTSVSASGQSDEPATRDFWYYVAYSKDACGNVAPVSNMTTGTLDYHLGDVSDGFTAGQGDNLVNTPDVSLLGSHYGISGLALVPYGYLDVGPTTDNTVNGRPTTDQVIDFEDLVMFALNHVPNASLIESKSHLEAAAHDMVSIESPAAAIGETFEASVRVAGSGDLQALSVALKWNAAVVKPVGASAGELLVSQRGVMFPPRMGTVDAAILGIGAHGLIGEGALATVQFRVIGAGDPGLGIERVIGRDASNHNVNVEIGSPVTLKTPIDVTLLGPAIPNPTHGSVVFSYTLAHRGPVDLSVYSVDGRRLKSLVSTVQESGQYQLKWNGTDERGNVIRSGVYYVRLEAAGIRQSRVITLLR